MQRKYGDLTFTLSRNVNLTEKWTYQPKHFFTDYLILVIAYLTFWYSLGFSLRFNRPYNTHVSYSFSSSADRRAMHRREGLMKSTSGRAGILCWATNKEKWLTCTQKSLSSRKLYHKHWCKSNGKIHIEQVYFSHSRSETYWFSSTEYISVPLWIEVLDWECVGGWGGLPFCLSPQPTKCLWMALHSNTLKHA